MHRKTALAQRFTLERRIDLCRGSGQSCFGDSEGVRARLLVTVFLAQHFQRIRDIGVVRKSNVASASLDEVSAFMS